MHLQTGRQAVTANVLKRSDLPALIVSLLLIWVVALQGIGYLRVRRTKLSITRPILYVQFGLFAAMGLFLWMNQSPRSTCVATFATTALFLPVSLLGRCMWVFVVEKCHSPFSVPRILLLGSTDSTRELIKKLSCVDCSCRVVGCLEAEGSHKGDSIEGVPILGSTATSRDLIFHNSVDVVIFTAPLNAIPDGAALAGSALDLGLHVGFLDSSVPESLISPDAEMSLGFFPGLPIITFSTVPFRPIYALSKRLLDIVVSATALVLLFPLMAVISLLIKLTSPDGPVFHRLDHVGLNGRSIVGYKFRTMVPNAHSLKPQLMGRNKMTGPVFKIPDDPRITPLGRWLRRYSLDELPQIYGVLKGELSLVGPRAPMREEAERFEYWQRRKLCVKPGLTCFWQVNGRSEISDFAEWVRLDLEYIRRASFFTDLKTLLRTVPVVLKGRGAY
jgi:exopolysaccharide biosynthesis polyprenyl glycosylphosphotransferase